MSYENLSDEDKIVTAIGFVARGASIPNVLATFLKEQHLYELIVSPQEMHNEFDQRNSSGHKPSLPDSNQECLP